MCTDLDREFEKEIKKEEPKREPKRHCNPFDRFENDHCESCG